MSLAGLHILLAEDNPTNQMVAVQMLESLGAKVTLAVDGAEALEMAAGEAFDVGLIDIEMPRVSGTDVIRRLRQGTGPCQAMPLIALTAYVMREHREAIDAAGADGVIAKPILSIEQLGEDILALMAPRRAQNRPPSTPAPAPTLDAPTLDYGGSIDLAIYTALEGSIGQPAMQELLDKVEIDLRAAGTRIAEGGRMGDIKAVREASHILISVAGAVGATVLQEQAQHLNTAAHAGKTETMAADCEGALAEIAAVLGFLKSRKQG
ncbi:MAG: response regulator [Pseudomonadota bacterium]